VTTITILEATNKGVIDPAKGLDADQVKLMNLSKEMLDKIINEKWIQANGIIGLFPANSMDDDILVHNPGEYEKLLGKFHCLFLL